MFSIRAIAALSVGISLSAVAQTERDLQSHVHGAAALHVVLDDALILMELETPWDNLVGFEHAPHTPAQHAAVDEALDKLHSPEQLFVLRGGECKLDALHIENTLGVHDDAHGDERKEEHAHDDAHGDEHKEEHGHDDAHEDEHGEEHGHDDAHEDHASPSQEQSAHASILATYSFQCSDIEKLSEIEVTLFSLWSGIHDLDVQWVGANNQTALELNPQNPVLSLSALR